MLCWVYSKDGQGLRTIGWSARKRPIDQAARQLLHGCTISIDVPLDNLLDPAAYLIVIGGRAQRSEEVQGLPSEGVQDCCHVCRAEPVILHTESTELSAACKREHASAGRWQAHERQALLPCAVDSELRLRWQDCHCQTRRLQALQPQLKTNLPGRI